MVPVLRLLRISVLLTLAALVAAPVSASAQDASGRPAGGVTQDETGRPPRVKKTTRPKKVIRAKTDDVDKSPTSSVIIRSYPPVADVIVDGRNVGTTADDGELELSDLKLGSHRIVLHKDGYREWSQTVVLKSATETEEIEPLLQSENPQFLRDLAKMTPIEFGKELSGRITRDSIAARDGKTFYNEYMLKVEDPDAYVVVLRGRGVSPTLRLVDDSNVPYSIQKVTEEVYQTAYVPHPGFYFVQVVSPLDESSFTSGDYSIRVLEESEAHGATPIAIGATASGMLDVTDRQSAPGDYFDAWRIAGQAGAQVHILVKATGFAPGLTLFLDDKVVASGGGTKDKKKKKGPADAADSAEIVTTLTGGQYTVYVRSLAGPKTGAYQLSVTMGG